MVAEISRWCKPPAADSKKKASPDRGVGLKVVFIKFNAAAA
jgi:hypothetical protein